MAHRLPASFGSRFRRLLAAFKRHEDVDRNPENFPEIGNVRAELEDARSAIAVMRANSWHEASAATVIKVDISESDRGRVRAQFFPQN